MLDVTTLKELFDDDVFIAKYLRLFLQDIDQQHHEIRKKAESQEFEYASIAAHTIKSQLQYMGVFEAAKLAQELESLFEKENVPSKENWMPVYISLQEQLSIIVMEINAWLETFERINA